MPIGLAWIGGLTCAGIWIYVLTGRGGFWRVRDEAHSCQVAVQPRRVAAIIPARDEAAVIGRAVASLLDQDSVGELFVFVVDDHSSDGTADAARAAQDQRVVVLPAGRLPEGWTGKVWALSEGIKRASLLKPEYFLLTDADIVHASDNVSQLVARAETEHFDLVSFMVKLRCRSFAERALIPAFVFLFFNLYPPNWVARGDRKTAAAAGGCILIRRDMLSKIGGLGSIKSELIDDCALARRVKRNGGRVWLGLTSTTHSIREYGTFTQVGNIISRTAYTQLNYSPLLLAGTVAALGVVFILPALLLRSGAGVLAYGLMCLSFVPTLRFYRRSPLWALTLPLVALFYMAATVHSAWLHWRGRGGEWKGRHLR